jgi:Fe-Mn family superoxide dismutase
MNLLSNNPLQALQADSQCNTQQPMAPAMALALAGSFGSEGGWREAFSALAHAHGSAGWLVLSFQPRTGMLVNQWLAADDADGLAGSVPILALGLQAQADLDSFMAHIAWANVYERYQHAVHEASEALAVASSAPEALQKRLVLDVRRQAVFEQSPHMLPGAAWRDPAKVADWAAELPAGSDVLVYCVYGHEVCRATALKLRARGVQASFLPGGIDAWASAGKPLQAKENA